MRLKLITGPLEEPVTRQEAKAHVKETTVLRDAEILRLIHSAREWAENTSGRALISQTWELILPAFPKSIELPKPPLLSVVTLKYRDTENVEQTLATSAYQVDDNPEGGCIVPASNTSWPSTYDRIDAVTVRFTCGYGGAGKVPYAIQAAILLHVEAHYDRDERVMEKLLAAADSLLFPHRVWTL